MDALIIVGACGIAVREIAPYVKSKKTDPAVFCIDEAGRFVIPLLFGHIGGANALPVELAEKLGATAVVTPATDVRGKFSVDAWAARHGCVISDMGLANDTSSDEIKFETKQEKYTFEFAGDKAVKEVQITFLDAKSPGFSISSASWDVMSATSAASALTSATAFCPSAAFSATS